MKNFGKLFLLGCLAMGLAACAQEEAPDQSGLSNEAVYLQVKLDMPVTRSATDNQGTTNSDADLDNEEGSVEESTITKLQLVLVDNAGKVIAASKPNFKPAGFGMYIAPFSSAELANFAGEAEKPYKVYAYCNIETALKAGDTFTGEDVTEAVEATWANNNFVMTSAKEASYMMPKKVEVLKHNSADNPLNIGAVEVERVAARFDFATKNVEFPMADNAQIVLTDIGIFNTADRANLFRHVSADGLMAGSTLLGKELPWTRNDKDDYTGGNYVVDAEAKVIVNTDAPVFTAISAMTTPDNVAWSDKSDRSNTEYCVYRYGVENTFAAAEAQVKDGATAFAFKGKIVGTKGELKVVTDAGTAPIYVFNNVLLGDWAMVAKYAKNEMVDGQQNGVDEILKGAYEAAENLKAGVTSEVDAAKAAGFKVFVPKNKVYEVYYNYYNRHNDNLLPKETCPMEFAVVRNNVYKLKVNKIGKYGDPEWTKPDPDDPIETDDVFFQVTVKILPWTVRVNNIEF